jgi:diguanylate cyclase (GGDEF)-like protein/PAS domain S-box-containing protein
MFKNALYGGLVVILLAALIGIQISRSYLSKPLKDLAAVSHAIGDGKLSVDIVRRERNDELGELTVSLDQMRKKILHAQEQKALVNERIADFAEISSDWLWETDAEGVFTYLSSTVNESLGYSVEEMQGKRMTDIFSRDNLSEIAMLFASEMPSHVGFKNLEIWLTTRQGYRICVRFNASPYFIDGAFQGYRGTASDITKEKNDEERLLRLANKDHLTGLSNRSRFMEELAREIHLAERQYTKGALLLIDLDHFKLINDTAGHAAGDEVIVQFAGLLKKMSRNADLVARLSGDEFVIAFVNTDISQIDKRINGIVDKINQLKPMYSGKVMNTTASVGVAIFPDHSNDPVDLLAKADTAMYKAKAEGRNRARIYEPGDQQQEKMGSQLIWKDRIHDAIEQEMLVLAFQPIEPTTGESASRYEVLVRMRSGEEGKYFYPGDFIPTAEQFGLIREIDNWVVKKAMGVLAGLSDAHSHISFTINLSGLSVGEPKMFSLIESELERTGLDRNRLIFEVTESAAFQDIGRAIEFIDRIKALGCRIALDDFGVGFSSFSYLKQLQADILKIDGSFIREIHQSKHDQLFVKALVDVARGMGMMTVAEFVESKEVYDVVRGIGVDYAQGYYIGEPGIGKFD